MVIVRVVLPWMANSVAIRRSRILKGVQFGYNALDAKKKQFAMRMFLRYSMDALVAFAESNGNNTRRFIESRRHGKAAFGGGTGPATGPYPIQRCPQVWC